MRAVYGSLFLLLPLLSAAAAPRPSDGNAFISTLREVLEEDHVDIRDPAWILTASGFKPETVVAELAKLLPALDAPAAIEAEYMLGRMGSSAAAPRSISAIVVIAMDDVRADRVGAVSGAKPSLTPRLDRFARSASVFLQARTQAPWSLPAYSTLMTSMHPSRHGVLNKLVDFGSESSPLTRLKDKHPEARTLAEVLRSAGWSTAGFTGGAALNGASGLSDGFEIYDDSMTFAGFDRTVPGALRWLDSRRAEERVFLFVHGYDAHPFHPGRLSKDLRARHEKMREEGLDGAAAVSTPDERRRLIAAYDGAVSALDVRLAPLLDRLEEPRWRERTLIVVLADHGEELFDHGGVDHGRTLYDELLRVPLFVRAPGLPPRRISAPVGLVDVMPTILDIVGVSADLSLAAQMDGVSLLPLMRGQPLALDSYAETDFLLSASLRSVVTRDNWKGILDRNAGRLRLYRLADDPRETADVSARFPGRAVSLRERLTAIDSRFDLVGSSAVTRGTWKAVRDGAQTRLFDVSSDPYLTRDEAERRPELVLESASEFMRAAALPQQNRSAPSEELRRKLREAGYW